MAHQITKGKRILDTLKSLPVKKLEEVLDFAEYLKSKDRLPINLQKTKRIKLPVFHIGRIAKENLDRSNLYGEYIDSKLG